MIGCDGTNSVVADFLDLKPSKLFSLSEVRGFTMYPSGHNFGNQFVQVKGDKCTVGRIPIHNKLVYWFVTQKVMYGRGGKFLILLYNTKSITIRIPSTPAYYDFVDRT